MDILGWRQGGGRARMRRRSQILLAWDNEAEVLGQEQGGGRAGLWARRQTYQAVSYNPFMSIVSDTQLLECWKQAWDVMGCCSGTISPTKLSDFALLADLRGYPDNGANKSYEEGGLVQSM